MQGTNWVKCSDKMPEVGQKILTYIANEGEYMMGEYDEPGCIFIYIGDGVYSGHSQFTHWMPLPPMPEGEL
ncbi:DUF551 domain-containing protein [Providencia rettgeri]|uniref:DUF551 domain-containing protein n=1 Tax=Providencia rettgeri TaxID=587 RepID=UPI001BCF65AC